MQFKFKNNCRRLKKNLTLLNGNLFLIISSFTPSSVQLHISTNFLHIFYYLLLIISAQVLHSSALCIFCATRVVLAIFTMLTKKRDVFKLHVIKMFQSIMRLKIYFRESLPVLMNKHTTNMISSTILHFVYFKNLILDKGCLHQHTLA